MSERDTARPLRLAIVRQRYNPFGGAERFVERALQALSGSGLDVTLIARKWDGPANDHFHLRKCRPPYLGRLSRDKGFAEQVRQIIQRNEFDIVQSHERIAGCEVFRAGDGVHATWLAQRLRTLTPWQRFLQKHSPWHAYTLAAEDAMFRDVRLRAVICNSHMVRDDIARRYPDISHKLHVIHNGVDLARFSPDLRATHRDAVRAALGVGHRTPVVVYVGSGFARKGVAQLIDALQKPALAQAELWIIGKDRDAQGMQARAKAGGLSFRVRFLGPQKDVAPYLGAADAFALPTLYDPMPNAALEALACGLPVLTSPMSGAAELIKPGFGAVVDALDIDGIARELARLLALAVDPAQRDLVCDAARHAIANMGSEDMATRQLALYRLLLAEAATRSPL
ncbi:MAG: glycosyltransferase family 4 protein [Rhodocyclaceae bacterium]